jgi:hypothetical protein
MSTVSAYPHIVKEPGAPARLASHPRTRVAMIVMDYLDAEIQNELDQLHRDADANARSPIWHKLKAKGVI